MVSNFPLWIILISNLNECRDRAEILELYLSRSLPYFLRIYLPCYFIIQRENENSCYH